MSSTWRLSPEQTREAVVRGGLEVLASEGLALGAERVSIERAAAYAKVPRATAYRLWKDMDVKPQEGFQRDLLCYVADHLAAGDEDDVDETAARVDEVLGEIGSIDDLSTDRRCHALARVIASGMAANVAALQRTPHWRIYAGVLATAGTRLSGSEDDDPLLDALTRGSEKAASRYAPMYLRIAEVFGLRLREGYTIEQFATLAGCLLEGLALRNPFTPLITDVTGPYHEVQGWTLFAAGFYGITREFFEAPS